MRGMILCFAVVLTIACVGNLISWLFVNTVKSEGNLSDRFAGFAPECPRCHRNSTEHTGDDYYLCRDCKREFQCRQDDETIHLIYGGE